MEFSPPRMSERRRKERVAVERPVQVRGVDIEGARFEIGADGAVLKNLSATGLMLHVQHSVEIGQKLFILFPVSTGMTANASVPTFTQSSIAVIGVVRRIEGQAQAGCSVGVEIVRHRFVYGGGEGLTQPGRFQA
jgi:hypothetical protein